MVSATKPAAECYKKHSLCCKRLNALQGVPEKRILVVAFLLVFSLEDPFDRRWIAQNPTGNESQQPEADSFRDPLCMPFSKTGADGSRGTPFGGKPRTSLPHWKLY